MKFSVFPTNISVELGCKTTFGLYTFVLSNQLKIADMKTYCLYLSTSIIYTHLPFQRLKSVLFSLQNELNEDLSDYFVAQNGTNIIKPASELGLDLSNVAPFDNLPSLKNRLHTIEIESL